MQVAVRAQNEFGLRLLSGVARSKPGANVLISPASLFPALAMTETGAGGPTQAAMRSAMSIPPDARDSEWHQAASALYRELRAAKGVELSMANAIWAPPAKPLAAAFIQRCRDLYDADAIGLDFARPDAADVINAWVKRGTKDMIPKIVQQDQVSGSDAILTNAVYFRGRWRDPFSPQETREAAFHLANGRQKKVAMMHQPRLEWAYRHGAGFEAAAMPYGDSGMALYAVLPAPNSSPEEALAKMKAEDLFLAKEPTELDLRLPRLALASGGSMKAPLIGMGMGLAFSTTSADFAPMGLAGANISDVIHKVRMDVDEQGTVAAAATVVLMAPMGMPPVMQKRALLFDRPFALLLCDTTTGAILFAGVVYEP